MNSIERIKAAINFTEPDKTPVLPQIFGHAAVLSGVDLSDYLRDGALLAECQINSLKMYQHDAVFALMDVSVESEAAGSVLKFKKGHYPVIEKYAFTIDAELNHHNIPDPSVSGRMPEILKATEILRNELGHHTAIIGCVLGPLTLVTQLLGAETALYLAVDNPEKFQEFMDFATETLIRFGIAQLNAGAHFPIVFDPSASNEVVPASFFREFELPCLKKVFSAFKAAGSPANWLHITGHIDDILEYFQEAGVDIANIDYCVDPQKAQKIIPRICIDGNIKPLDFVNADKNEVAEEAKWLLNIFKKRGGFLLSSGCEIPPEARPANVLAMISAREEDLK